MRASIHPVPVERKFFANILQLATGCHSLPLVALYALLPYNDSSSGFYSDRNYCVIKGVCMNIEGTYTLQAAPEDVWQGLSDHTLLQQSIPSLEQLEQVGEHTYALAMHITQTPLLGVYYGQVSLAEKHMPYHCRILIESNGRQSSISGNGSIHLHKHDDTTIVVYKGTLQIGKLGTLLPPALVRGATKLVIQQFFTALAAQLRTRATDTTNAAFSQGSEGLAGEATRKQAAEDILILTRQAAPQHTPTVVGRLVQLLNLGSGEPEQALHWEQRLRRIGVVSGLLFLVWVGTRLPRRL